LYFNPHEMTTSLTTAISKSIVSETLF